VQYVDGLPVAWGDNEPKGPQASGSADDDPWRLTLAAATSWMSGAATYVLHTGPGVRFGGLEDRGRAANFWEVANIDAILTGLRTVRSLLPPDVANWQRWNSNPNFPEYPYVIDPVQRAVDRGTILRAFCVGVDVRRICAPMQIGGPVGF